MPMATFRGCVEREGRIICSGVAITIQGPSSPTRDGETGWWGLVGPPARELLQTGTYTLRLFDGRAGTIFVDGSEPRGVRFHGAGPRPG
jgi:hypothetical protein